MFHNRWLKVDYAIEPSLIMWENLGHHKKERLMRIMCTKVISVLLLMSTVFAILLIKGNYYELKTYTPEIECGELEE